MPSSLKARTVHLSHQLEALDINQPYTSSLQSEELESTTTQFALQRKIIQRSFWKTLPLLWVGMKEGEEGEGVRCLKSELENKGGI